MTLLLRVLLQMEQSCCLQLLTRGYPTAVKGLLVACIWKRRAWGSARCCWGWMAEGGRRWHEWQRVDDVGTRSW